MFSNSRTIFNHISNELTSIYDQEEANSIAYLVLEELAGIKKSDILIGHEINISKNFDSKVERVLDRLRSHEPVQYIFGKAHFYGIEFLVDQNVLIPRQETEELVDWILRESHGNEKILDIGTGSGCIAISLAKHLSNVHVSAWDISASALEMAMKNAINQKTNVSFQCIDILAEIPSGTYDLIVSNPPYIRSLERENMHQNVLDFEPDTALFVPDDDPLLFYRTINQISPEILRPGGWIYYELNEAYGQEVVLNMEEHSFTDIEIRKDINGKDRMVRGRKR
ncbi:MAG: peptide chain release factor N(5)-glutamine methyltransferase [Bacteroidota bacterium]